MHAPNKLPSLRFGGGLVDLRLVLLKICGFLQRKKVIILDDDPELCGKVLASSVTKGTFIEHLFAVPAWDPILSVESMDGVAWERLSRNFQKVLGQSDWTPRWNSIIKKQLNNQVDRARSDPEFVIDSQEISRMVLRVFFELLFEREIERDDENLFFQASMEWRKEIAIKSPGDKKIKNLFVSRLTEHIGQSKFGNELNRPGNNIEWISVFAQPFLISPQINISDIFSALFEYLNVDSSLLQSAQQAAVANDKTLLNGFILESIRLKHPFPILEREISNDLVIRRHHYSAGTQFLITLDRFRQDSEFNPQRWAAKNSYESIIFAAGGRMCPGKPLAMELIREFLKSFLTDFPIIRIQPKRNHRWSGRSNDSGSEKYNTIYQHRTFAQALLKSFKIGRTPSVCPFPHRQRDQKST